MKELLKETFQHKEMYIQEQNARRKEQTFCKKH